MEGAQGWGPASHFIGDEMQGTEEDPLHADSPLHPQQPAADGVPEAQTGALGDTQIFDPRWTDLRARHQAREAQLEFEKLARTLLQKPALPVDPGRNGAGFPKKSRISENEEIDLTGHLLQSPDRAAQDDDGDEELGPDVDEIDQETNDRAEVAARESGGATPIRVDDGETTPIVGGDRTPPLGPHGNEPDILMVLIQLTMQQQELLKKMDNVGAKLEEKLNLHQRTLGEKMTNHQKQQQKTIDNVDKKITKQAKEQTKALDNMDVKFKDSLRQMNERMDKIENKTIPATPTAVRSRSSPVTETRWTTPRTPSATFEPKMVHIQGWGAGSGVGLTQAEGRELGAMLKNKLPDEIQMLIDDILCNYMVNTRVTLRIAGGREACWKVKRAFDEIFRQQPMTVKGKNIFALVEAPPKSATRAESWRSLPTPSGRLPIA